MARTFQFDVGRVVEQLDRILQMELAAVIYYTHYSFMIYGHARIPITSWLRDNATESLTHAQEAGEMIMRLHKRPALGIAALPTTAHNTIDEILTESIQREEAGVELYRELLALVKDKSVSLPRNLATRRFFGSSSAAFTACSKLYCRNGFASVICCNGSMPGGSSAKPVAKITGSFGQRLLISPINSAPVIWGMA
jgi:bacterioferritin